MHPLSKITVSTYAQTAGCCPGVEHSTTSFFTWILLNVCMSLAEGEMNPFLKTKGREGDVTVPSESFHSSSSTKEIQNQQSSQECFQAACGCKEQES